MQFKNPFSKIPQESRKGTDRSGKSQPGRRKGSGKLLGKDPRHVTTVDSISGGKSVDLSVSQVVGENDRNARDQSASSPSCSAGSNTRTGGVATDSNMSQRLKGHGVERSTMTQPEKDERHDEGLHLDSEYPETMKKDLPEPPAGAGRKTPTISSSAHRRPVATKSGAISRSNAVAKQRSLALREGEKGVKSEHNEEKDHMAELRASHVRRMEILQGKAPRTQQEWEECSKKMEEIYKAERRLLKDQLRESRGRVDGAVKELGNSHKRSHVTRQSPRMVDAKAGGKSYVRMNFDESSQNAEVGLAVDSSESSKWNVSSVNAREQSRLDDDSDSQGTDADFKSLTSSIHEQEHHALTVEQGAVAAGSERVLESQQDGSSELDSGRKSHEDENRDLLRQCGRDAKTGQESLKEPEKMRSAQDSLAIKEAEQSLKTLDKKLHALEDTHKAELQKAADRYREELEEAKTTLKAESDTLLEKQRIVLEETNTRLDECEKQLTINQAAWEKEKQKMQSDHCEKLQEKEDKHEQESDKVAKAHRESEFKLRREHETAKVSTSKQHKTAYDQLVATHQNATTKLTQGHDKELNKRSLEYEDAVKKLGASLTEEKKSSDLEQSKLRAELAALRKTLNDAQQQHDREQMTLKADLGALQKTLIDEREVNTQEQSILRSDVVSLRQALADERQQYEKDQQVWADKEKTMITAHRGDLDRQVTKHLKALEDDKVDFDQKLSQETEKFNRALETMSATIATQKKDFSDARAKWDKDQLLKEQAHRDADRRVREEHADELTRTKHDCGTRVRRLSREHKIAIGQAEEDLRQYKVTAASTLQKHKANAAIVLEQHKQDATVRLKTSEDTAAETLAQQERTAAATLKKREQDAADKLSRQLELNEEQRLQFDATLASLEEKHHKALEQWQSNTTAAHAHLKAEIQARNKALIARETSRSHTDGELKSLFLGIIDDVDGLARLKWTFNKSAWTDDLQKELSDSPKRLRKQILQETIWGVLHEQIFGSPFRMLGEEGKKLEAQWLKDFGNIKAAPKAGGSTYIWPKPSFPSERWRYETLRQLEDATKNPISEYDPRQKLLAGFQESLSSACKEISDSLEQVTELDEKTIVAVKHLVGKAANMWITFGAQRCRLVVAMTDLKVTTESCNPKVGGDRCVELVARPELRRLGDTDGALYDSVAKISGCEGEMIRILY